MDNRKPFKFKKCNLYLTLIIMTEKTEQATVLTERELELQNQLVQVQQQLNKSNAKGIDVTSKLNMLQSSPEIQTKLAELEYQVRLAQYMIESKAFPNMTPAQAIVTMKAGKEMGMDEIESLTDLYIVNGQVKFHSKGLAGRITKYGYKISFTNESADSVTVTITKESEGFSQSYIVRASEQILQRSKAMGFAKANKMRFHGIRQIANFHLAHLFGSAALWDEDDMDAAKERQNDNGGIPNKSEKEKERIIKLIENAKTIDDVNRIVANIPHEHEELIEMLADKKNEIEALSKAKA
jgi:hypothetical protein